MGDRRRADLLRKAREKYPHRLVRNHNIEPKPETIETAVYGDFARFPAASGDEWLFSTRAGLVLFLQRYGGTILGE